MPKDHTRVLGLDYGTHKIGVAFGQSISKTATPLGIVSVKNLEPNWPTLKQFIERWQPNCCLIGLPLNMDGTDSAITDKVHDFRKLFNQHFALTTHLIDERLSTREARWQIEDLKTRHPKTQKIPLDAWAAAILIENWFNNIDI